MNNLTSKLRNLIEELESTHLDPCPNGNHLWKPFAPDIYKCALCGEFLVRITNPDKKSQIRDQSGGQG